MSHSYNTHEADFQVNSFIQYWTKTTFRNVKVPFFKGFIQALLTVNIEFVMMKNAFYKINIIKNKV